MNFSIAYQEIGRFLEYRDLENNQKIFLENAVSGLFSATKKMCSDDKNTNQWYEGATDFLLRLCVIGNIKGLILHQVNHQQNDQKIIEISAGIIANQLQGRADGLRFSHLAIPARSVYRLAPSETRLNYEMENDFSRMYEALSTKKIIQVNARKFKQRIRVRTNQMLAGHNVLNKLENIK